MKSLLGILPVVVCAGIGFAMWGVDMASPALAGPELVSPAAIVTLPALTDEATYVGSKKCKKCHMSQHKSWKKTEMGTALDTLKPGETSEAKTKSGLDASKDYTQDETCLKCHTTGYGEAGGYAVPDPTDKKAVKKAKKLAGVGCESCHGPGSNYVKQHDEIMKSKRKYTQEEMYAAGLRKIDADTCTACHNEQSPTFESFDYEKQKEEGIHEHAPLKQREG